MLSHHIYIYNSKAQQFFYSTQLLYLHLHSWNNLSSISSLPIKYPLFALHNLSTPVLYKSSHTKTAMAPIRINPSAAMRTLQMAQRRQFSVIARIRQAARDFEPHPFERYPTTVKAAPADWGRQFRKLGGAAML